MIQTERFCVGGKPVVHEDGAKTECLWWFIELRPKFPELFNNLVIFSQPSAVHDEISHLWDIEDIKDQFALVLNLRDLLHVGFTQKSKAATRLYQQINAWIAGGMTPVLQWTDTDGACDAKIGAEVAKRDMITELKDQAKAVGKEAIGFKLDTYGILKVVNAAHDKMVDSNDKKDTVLAGTRRNGFLEWRPDPVLKKLVRADEQAWCRNADGSIKFPLGSHRMREDWHKDRHSWLQPDGTPVVEDWSQSNSCIKANEMGEPEDSAFSIVLLSQTSLPKIMKF